MLLQRLQGCSYLFRAISGPSTHLFLVVLAPFALSIVMVVTNRVQQINCACLLRFRYFTLVEMWSRRSLAFRQRCASNFVGLMMWYQESITASSVANTAISFLICIHVVNVFFFSYFPSFFLDFCFVFLGFSRRKRLVFFFLLVSSFCSVSLCFQA